MRGYFYPWEIKVTAQIIDLMPFLRRRADYAPSQRIRLDTSMHYQPDPKKVRYNAKTRAQWPKPKGSY